MLTIPYTKYIVVHVRAELVFIIYFDEISLIVILNYILKMTEGRKM